MRVLLAGWRSLPRAEAPHRPGSSAAERALASRPRWPRPGSCPLGTRCVRADRRAGMSDCCWHALDRASAACDSIRRAGEPRCAVTTPSPRRLEAGSSNWTRPFEPRARCGDGRPVRAARGAALVGSWPPSTRRAVLALGVPPGWPSAHLVALHKFTESRVAITVAAPPARARHRPRHGVAPRRAGPLFRRFEQPTARARARYGKRPGLAICEIWRRRWRESPSTACSEGSVFTVTCRLPAMDAPPRIGCSVKARWPRPRLSDVRRGRGHAGCCRPRPRVRHAAHRPAALPDSVHAFDGLAARLDCRLTSWLVRALRSRGVDSPCCGHPVPTRRRIGGARRRLRRLLPAGHRALLDAPSARFLSTPSRDHRPYARLTAATPIAYTPPPRDPLCTRSARDPHPLKHLSLAAAGCAAPAAALAPPAHLPRADRPRHCQGALPLSRPPSAAPAAGRTIARRCLGSCSSTTWQQHASATHRRHRACAYLGAVRAR